MWVGRRFGAVLSILTVAVLLAPPAGAQPPTKLTDHLTDSSGVLTPADRAAVNAAIDRLYRDRHTQLWVVYVDNFSRFRPDNWADRTRSTSAIGDRDALLAVATNTKLYTFTASAQSISAGDLNSLRSNKIEPAVRTRDWAGAAVAAADGLTTPATAAAPPPSPPEPAWNPQQPPKPPWVTIAVGAAAILLAIVVLVVVLRARRRRAGPGAGHADAHAAGDPLSRALSTAETRLRQISDYAARHHDALGAEARARLDAANGELAAAREAAVGDGAAAIAHANSASTLAAEAQTLANADVAAAHRPRRRGSASAKR
ncbi:MULTISPECIES: YgcG family protein [unclassified Mycobacterium]|uniref:TPM domain-containing protein n=1 Tax=unclassified Mycobacterium TaxID=2642494 RepID=UPI000800D4C1|nr:MULTISPECIES: TPM domain-containing protein [unclassified Mycobacterium]OBG74800.1 hypothetical protein A5700_03655 [Mycobacterium sp. E1214]OBH27462.1 hypothetical protein A5693_23755 [Mycobacterium sp. E1319]